MNWKDKRVLITGGYGMIGMELFELLEVLGANVEIADLVDGQDLTDYKTCENVCLGKDYVFHLAGIKGSPKMTKERPVDFMAPMLAFDRNMIVAAQKMNVKRFLYTSSIAVEHPESDLYPATAKLAAERLIDAMHIQYDDGTQYCVVRPANVYGRYDNFNNPNAMVVTSLINKALTTRKINLMTDGTEIRDFINAKDVAAGMIKAMEELPDGPVNLCSGEGVSILDLVKVIIANTSGALLVTTHDNKADCQKRVMNRNWDNPLTISLEEGIKEVIDWKQSEK